MAYLGCWEYGFEVPDSEFTKLLWLNKGVTLELIREIEPYLPKKSSDMKTSSKVSSKVWNAGLFPVVLPVELLVISRHGCIDGTHIAIVKVAYKVCESDLNIMSIDAGHHGGASHDSHIWNYHPPIKGHLVHLHESENETEWLLGDSGYPLHATLMTSITNTEPSTPEC